QQGGILSGTVTDSHGHPIAGLGVLAYNGDVDGDGACTSKTGAFSIPQLPPGRYAVEFFNACGATGNWAPQYYPGKVNPATAVPVRVRLSQHVTGIDATMRPGSTITGTVTSQAGRPLRRICVALLEPD